MEYATGPYKFNGVNYIPYDIVIEKVNNNPLDELFSIEKKHPKLCTLCNMNEKIFLFIEEDKEISTLEDKSIIEIKENNEQKSYVVSVINKIANFFGVAVAASGVGALGAEKALALLQSKTEDSDAKVNELFNRSIVKEQEPIVTFPSEESSEESFDQKDKSIIEIKEELDQKGYVLSVINKIASFLGMGAAVSGLGALSVETTLGMVAYTNAPVVLGNSWFALSTQYVMANFAGNAAGLAVATQIPLLGLPGVVVANTVLGLGVKVIGSKVAAGIYNSFVAKTPEEMVSIDLKDSAIEFISSQITKSESEKK
ncbi:MAG: hypothetical protein H0W50_11515 [Parachlamydiaceae bacterium]|nr:hypothetical protein [Parachlamydiaceae bacterium]